jgi:hypothetical protein
MTCRGVEVYVHSFLALTSVGSEFYASPFYTQGNNLGLPLDTRLLGPQGKCGRRKEKKNQLLSPGSPVPEIVENFTY